ncbi:Autophagy-related protein 9 [Sesbania bispinosa]|nr:Autophagy-related protein 9 [Sesbania bispinosa]
MQIFGRNLLWYAAVFGTITAISRAAIVNELLVLDHEGAMSMVVQHTHYMPKRWRGRESTEMVRIEFETLFQYTGMMLLEEMASIFLTPYLLLWVVPKRVDDILQFIADFTVDVEGVGHVCSFSVFDFQKHGNSSYDSPYNSPRSQRSSQGKLEKSFLSFQSSYPSWEPNAQGKQFLLNLRTFREQKLSEQADRDGFSPLRMWRGSPNMGSNGDRNRFMSREMPYSTFETGNHLGSLWLIEANNQNNHPYLLDWYYTSRPHDVTSRDVPTDDQFEVTEHHSRDWMPSNLAQNDPQYEDYINEYCDDRAASHLGASTSAPIFRESLIQDHNSNDLTNTTRSHWWARSHPQSVHGQTSFFEPPDFNQQRAYNYYDKFSDRGSEDQDQEQQLHWRDHHRLSRTQHTDDLESGEFNLHFDDIYSRPPENPTVNPNTPSI